MRLLKLAVVVIDPSTVGRVLLNKFHPHNFNNKDSFVIEEYTDILMDKLQVPRIMTDVAINF